MSEIWKPQSKEVYQHWIDTIMNEASDKLTNWETDFVDNISTQLLYRGTLTQYQAEKLEQIYAEKTS